MNHLQGEDNSIIRTRCSNKILVLFFTKYQKKINTLNSELSNCSMKNARDVLCVTLLALSISWDGYSGALIWRLRLSSLNDNLLPILLCEFGSIYHHCRLGSKSYVSWRSWKFALTSFRSVIRAAVVGSPIILVRSGYSKMFFWNRCLWRYGSWLD